MLKSSNSISLRRPLQEFAEEMEKKLLAHDHKKHWLELPVEALLRLLRIELQEFDVALEFFDVAEARKELLDLSNYAMMIWDRLGAEPQDKPFEKPKKGK